MAQTFTLATANPRQDAALAWKAARLGLSVDDMIGQQFRALVQGIVSEWSATRPVELTTAYANAPPATRAQIDALLGLS